MAGNTYQLIVDAVWKGQSAFRQAGLEMARLDEQSKKGGRNIGDSFAKAGIAAGAFGLAMAGVAAAAGKAYSVLREGAALVTTQQRFDKLSASIGTTADTLLGKLRTATKGMISDMELMSSASGIISLRLAENEDQVVRLATVVGTLGWDMQQVILTFANLSTMRLDALGLSVTEVKNKQSELMKQGMSEIEAFKEAVIQAGEARLNVGGVSETEQQFKQLEAAIANSKNEIALLGLELGKTFGIIEAIGNLASRMELTRKIRELNEELKRTGQITPFEAFAESTQIGEMSTEQLAALVDVKMAQIGNALLINSKSWGGWAMSVSADAQAAAAAAVAASTEMFRAMVAGQQLDWMGGPMGTPTPLASNIPGPSLQQTANTYAVWIDRINKRNRAAEEERASLLASEQAVYSYGGALSVVDQREQSLIATHSRMAAAFSSEAFSDAADGLINADGTANAEALSKALYDQAKAAGATAGQLALLGVATGALTEDQARAALKAAVLTEQARKLAMAVVAGQIGFGEAASGMITFGAELDAQAAGQDLTSLATAADNFAESVYEAELAVDNDAANLGLMASIDLANEFAGTYTATLVTNYVTGTGTAAGATGTTGGTTGGTPSYDPNEDNRSGPFNKSGGADLLPYGGGSIYPNSRSAGMYTSYQGGSSVNVTVTNYVDGKMERSSLDDVTTDALKRAMAEIGMVKR